ISTMTLTLDDVRRIDASRMYELLTGFPDQWKTGRKRALEADLDGIAAYQPQAVLVAGMGGSAIGGDLLRTLALHRADIPILVSRSYQLPAWVGPHTAVVISSYSGHTEETLAVLEAAMERGAKVVCIAA